MKRLSPLQQLKPKRIGLFRALQLGDWLCAIPAVRALREACPGAQLTLVGLPWSRTLIERFPHYFDEFIEFPGWPGLRERPVDSSGLASFLETVQQRRFDLAVQMHGSGAITNPLVAAFGARSQAGFCLPGHYCPDPALSIAWPEHEHEVRRLLRLMAHLGADVSDEDLEFPLRDDDAQALADAGLLGLLEQPYVCIHAGARLRHKCWQPQSFAAVADALAERGYQIVLTGSAQEADVTSAVMEHMRSPAIDTAALNLPLGPLAQLLADSALVVCNDTGVSHLATAVKAKSVVIFSATDPSEWAPLDTSRHVALCNPEGVKVCDVVESALAQLASAPALVFGSSSVSHDAPRRAKAEASRCPSDFKLDVLIPTYQRPASLAVTLTSLCAQSWKRFRVIVSDQTEEFDVCDAAELQTPLRILRAHGHEVILHKHLPRRGLAEHRQFLLDQVQSPYCLFLDDDLVLEPEVIDQMMKAMRAEACGFVGSAVIGLSYIEDVRPHQQHIEFWEGPVQPETVRPGDPAWNRHHLHSAANLYHVQNRLGFSPEATRKYRVAWVGACVLYDTEKLRMAGGFEFWDQLPTDHCGEDVLAQTRVMSRFGGCGLIPSGVYHQELPTTITNREVDAPHVLEL